MKNLFFFTALIFLMFSAGATLKAQGFNLLIPPQNCFTMSIAEVSIALDESCYQITVDNDRQNSVDVYDDKGEHTTTCPANSTITFNWCYDAPLCGDVFEIICKANGPIQNSCTGRDGCVIVIEPREICP